MNETTYEQGRAWIELNMAALKENVIALGGLLPSGCKLMPAIKADAYGHGAILIANELNKLGIKDFCVATVKEGVELRQNGIYGNILVLGYTHPQEFDLILQYNLTQTVIDYQYGKLLEEFGQDVHVHIGVDTGMHRLGESAQNIDSICKLFSMKNLCIDGIFTHLCVSDSENIDDRAFTNAQYEAFRELIEKLSRRGYSCIKTHILSSYGILNYPEMGGDYARVGIALCGVLSKEDGWNSSEIELTSVLSLKARISTIKNLRYGESAGYGLAFHAERDSKVAMLSIGYADGLPRALSNGKGRVLINGCLAPIIGRICMDQTLIDVTDIVDINRGDVAVLIGNSRDKAISVYDIAMETNTITNEVLSRLGARLERFAIR